MEVAPALYRSFLSKPLSVDVELPFASLNTHSSTRCRYQTRAPSRAPTEKPSCRQSKWSGVRLATSIYVARRRYSERPGEVQQCHSSVTQLKSAAALGVRHVELRSDQLAPSPTRSIVSLYSVLFLFQIGYYTSPNWSKAVFEQSYSLAINGPVSPECPDSRT